MTPLRAAVWAAIIAGGVGWCIGATWHAARGALRMVAP